MERKLVLTLGLLLFLLALPKVDATTSGPNYPTTKTSQSVIPEDDITWTNPTNIGADDGAYASVTSAAYDTGKVTYRLKAQNFGFSVDPDATIDGILVEIEKYCGAGQAEDFHVWLIGADGNPTGNDRKETSVAWDATPTKHDYGGATDLWGVIGGLTPTIVNDADFGVWISAFADLDNTDVYVDFLRMSVFFTVAAGGQDLTFTVDQTFGVTADRVKWHELRFPSGLSFGLETGSSLGLELLYGSTVAPDIVSDIGAGREGIAVISEIVTIPSDMLRLGIEKVILLPHIIQVIAELESSIPIIVDSDELVFVGIIFLFGLCSLAIFWLVYRRRSN